MTETLDRDPEAAAIDEALRAYDSEIEALRAARPDAENDLPAALRIVRRARGKLIVSGIGKSGHIGRKIAASAASLGTPAFFVHATEALHGDSGMVADGDVAILISNSGETAEVCAFASMLRAWGIPVIAMTGGAESTLARTADAVLRTRVDVEADPHDLAPSSSTTLTLVLGDALAIGLAAAQDFGPADFGRRHPGGSLGARTTTASLDEGDPR